MTATNTTTVNPWVNPTITGTSSSNKTSETSAAPEQIIVREYSFAREGLVPCTIFAALGYGVHRHSGDAIANQDWIFSIGFLLYVFAANAIAFNGNQLQLNQWKQRNIRFQPMGQHSLGRGEFITEPSFLIYFAVSKMLGVLVPLVMMVAAPTEIATMLAPSLAVLLVQAVAEQSTVECHDVLRMAVPIAYSTYRLFGPLQVWAVASYDLYLDQSAGEEEESSRSSMSAMYHVLNLGVAWANLLFGAYNLFGFLILRALPVYFDKDETPRVEMAYTLLPIPKKNNIKTI